eukprot:TRINITY_DN3129_c0_g1_i2.p1 TRINITY_DN3129_c0_g1~~TRINITY_DN3129_c0_g1_i2.p1  ORF type:complete len:256 (+),score=16.90 TRINITY_DN3129_c0_g1_i2:96-770(+)
MSACQIASRTEIFPLSCPTNSTNSTLNYGAATGGDSCGCSLTEIPDNTEIIMAAMLSAQQNVVVYMINNLDNYGYVDSVPWPHANVCPLQFLEVFNPSPCSAILVAGCASKLELYYLDIGMMAIWSPNSTVMPRYPTNITNVASVSYESTSSSMITDINVQSVNWTTAVISCLVWDTNTSLYTVDHHALVQTPDSTTWEYYSSSSSWSSDKPQYNVIWQWIQWQ